MSPTSAAGRGRDDRGVTLIIMALGMVATLLIIATVVDFGNVRNGRQSNKLTSDVVASAGLQALAQKGVPRPWRGACSALDYLEVNEPDLVPFDITYMTGAGVELTGDPCADPVYLDRKCAAATPASWAWIRAVSANRSYDLRTGYVLPDPAFPEDASIYAGDTGDPVQGGCDQLAVISSRTDPAFFGGVVGAVDYSTAARTVGRFDPSNTAGVAIALVLLEPEDCQALDFPSGSGALSARGSGDQSGIIHSDSRGNGDDCGSGEVVIEGKNSGGPMVRALAAPNDPNTRGLITTFAAAEGGTNGANWTPSRFAAETEVWVCDPDSGASGPTPCPDGPSDSERITRRPVDLRYLGPVNALRATANAVFTQIQSGAVPTGYTRYTSIGGDCNLNGSDPPVTITSAQATRLFVDCSNLSIGNGKVVTFGAGVTDVAFEGNVSFSGDGMLDARAPQHVYVHNRRTGPGATAALATGSQGQLLLNMNGEASCDARRTAAPSATNELVVRRGGIDTQAGGRARLCSTFVHLMGGQTGTSPVDTTAAGYPNPYDNMTNDGTVSVSAGSDVQWTAPNTLTTIPTTADYRFEDLALWTETQQNNFIGGGGGLVLGGAFFFPNTGPSSGVGGLSMVGGTSGVVDLNAQLWVRKMQMSGGADFRLRSSPADTVVVPFLANAGLVR